MMLVHGKLKNGHSHWSLDRLDRTADFQQLPETVRAACLFYLMARD